MKKNSLFRKLPGFASAESGVAAIEFAFILPFMLVLYFGLLDLTGLVSVNRKMTSTASVVADLTGQGGPTTRSQILKEDIADYMAWQFAFWGIAHLVSLP
jgi:Flp pilus assembly protein TadG